jgi:hypothetical protein
MAIASASPALAQTSQGTTQERAAVDDEHPPVSGERAADLGRPEPPVTLLTAWLGISDSNWRVRALSDWNSATTSLEVGASRAAESLRVPAAPSQF